MGLLRRTPPAGPGTSFGLSEGLAANTFWVLDSPNIAMPAPHADRIDVRGWVATTGRLGACVLVGAPGRLTTAPRPDVTAAFGLPAIGFAASIDRRVLGGEPVSVSFDVDGVGHAIIVPTPSPVRDRNTARLAKRSAVRPHLRCVDCGGRVEDAGEVVRCVQCHSSYDARDGAPYDFLPQHLRAEFDIVPTENVSSNVYDGVMMNLINSHVDGLILDCGAGRQALNYPNVVNLEVVAYDSTDVLAVGERLPFGDDTFDVVASFAVLEHVKDPSRCASEIQRVLKPGGIFYGQVPFLQPVHAYPNHFFNMTMQGFASLFDGLETLASGVIPFGQPIFALSWMLNKYSAGLPPQERAAFESMTVKELMEPAERALGSPHVVQLDSAARDVLACANFLIARMPSHHSNR